MAKPELGTKRLCGSCGAKFYDLEKDPIVCPKCGSVYEVVVTPTRGRPDAAAARAAKPEEVVEAPEAAEVELVSLEEADKETEGAKATAVEGAEEEEIEMDESLDDAAFLEESEDENEDVTDIIGGDIENEEET